MSRPVSPPVIRHHHPEVPDLKALAAAHQTVLNAIRARPVPTEARQEQPAKTNAAD